MLLLGEIRTRDRLHRSKHEQFLTQGAFVTTQSEISLRWVGLEPLVVSSPAEGEEGVTPVSPAPRNDVLQGASLAGCVHICRAVWQYDYR